MSQWKTTNPREAAYLILLTTSKSEGFAADFLKVWVENASPTKRDHHLCREIVFGVTRMVLSLDYIAKQLTDKEKLKLKLKEKIILRIALYQHVFMDKIPAFAINNESLEIAKRYCHLTFVSFLNAILRRVSDQQIELPSGTTVPELSTRYSYPPYFVQLLLKQSGLEKAIQVMEAGNAPSPTMFRVRPDSGSISEIEGVELITGANCTMGIIRDSTIMDLITSSDKYYIQNITSAYFINSLAKNFEKPNDVLDLLAAPGGKTITTFDLFPDAHYFVNDISKDRVVRLKENLEKYGVAALVTTEPAEEYKLGRCFDLIILDVLCSNTGVLSKRVEARWRIESKNIESLQEKQLQIVKQAEKLLSPKGEIWYMTCSILKDENEAVVEKACQRFGLKVRKKELILPNKNGWDGGFAASLIKE